jgi:hypothetical protein
LKADRQQGDHHSDHGGRQKHTHAYFDVIIEPFPNVDIYPLVTQLLGLRITDKIDGTTELADEVLLR